MSKFDPYRWVSQAISAGLDPVVMRYSDGSGRTLWTSEIDVDRDLEPPRGHYMTLERMRAVADVLEMMGRVADVPPPSKPIPHVKRA